MYRLTVMHDDMPENPMDEDTLFILHSFSNRHINYTDPNVLLACQYEFPEGHEDEGFYCDELPHDDTDHEYEGPEGFFLSYFEHGLCKWGLQGTMSGMPDFRWDGVEYAGFLEVKPDNEWYERETDERKRELAQSMVDVYTDFCNGNTYGYRLEKVVKEECDRGYVHDESEELDSCWGFIGEDHLLSELRMTLDHFEVTEDNLEVVDKAFGAAEYMDFFPKVAA